MDDQRQAWARHLPDGVEAGALDLLARGSLPAAWAVNWASDPAREVVRDPDGTWLTGADLLALTTTVAGRLHGAGLRPGDRVLLTGFPSARFVVAYAAALRAGFVVVPLNPSYSRREVEALLVAARPKAAVVASDEVAGWLAQADPELVVTGPTVELLDGPAPKLDRSGVDDPALLPFTSGTTGVPKGVVLSHGNLLAAAETLLLAWRWTAEDRLVLALPLFHMHGLGVALHGTLLAGASVVLHPSFDPEAVLAAADDDATLFFGVPTMYRRLVGAERPERMAGLRLAVSGSAPLPADLHREIGDRCGQTVLERYGMTETVMLVSNPYDGERRAGTVGFPLPGVELRLAPGTDEIEVRGPNVFAGYLANPEANAAAFTSDGWFRTGDIGHVDADGYVSIVGRAKELIISGGYNVYPREIEDLLRAHPAVVDAAVVGTPSVEWGEVVTAYVELGDEPMVEELGEELLEWAAQGLAPYKRPRLVHAVVELPRNKLGKVLRDQLTPPE
ncbi:MAG TPA: AMP-binding protein [Acidimicrobiales bacterium]